jgi:hypothetical protein
MQSATNFLISCVFMAAFVAVFNRLMKAWRNRDLRMDRITEF